MTVGKASAIGFGAVVIWAMLAPLSMAADPVPPFQLSAICFTIGGMIGLVWVAAAGRGLARLRRIGPAVWLVGLGVGPVGLAFYLWDIGVKRGNIQLLGVAAYAAPLLSTLILVGAGIATPTLGLLAAAALITGGALIAARA